MKRTIKIDFRCSRENLEKLFACNRISAMVYNKVLDLQREYRKDHADRGQTAEVHAQMATTIAASI